MSSKFSWTMMMVHYSIFSAHSYITVSDKSFVYQQKNQELLEECFAEFLQVNC